MTLELVSHPLPVAWDGRRVRWDRWEDALPVNLCPPPKPDRCMCGSTRSPFTARGMRDPAPGSTMTVTRPKRGRFGRMVPVPRQIPAYPVYDLTAFRCPACGEVAVWDMESNEHWILDDSDYGPRGSRPPSEWSGGLLDLLQGDDA